MRISSVSPTTVIFALLGVLLSLFVLLPLLSTIVATEPALLWETMLDPEVRGAILLSLQAALVATLIALVLGVPLAYLLARYEFPGKQLVEGVVNLPMVIPHSAAGIALLMVFGRQRPLGVLFSLLGLRFVAARPGIVIAMLFVSLPLLVNAAREGFAAVDPRLENVARTLGASPWIAFWRIALPLAWRNILSGAILMWARGLSEFGAVIVLAYHPMTAPVLLYERFESFGLAYARPVATLMILLCLVIFVVLRLVADRRRKEG